MASDDIRGIKMYLGRKFESGGGGVTIRGTAYAEGETGLKSLADAVFTTAQEEIVITSTSFEGGVSSGQVRFSRTQMLTAIEELLEDMGYGSTVCRSMFVGSDFTGAHART
jgi:hypothetical protein